MEESDKKHTTLAYKDVIKNGSKSQKKPALHTGKYLRREVRAEFKRIAYQIRFLLLFDFDASGAHELERFHVLQPLSRYFETRYLLPEDSFKSDRLNLDLDKLLRVAKPVSSRAARRSLKLMRRQLKPEICKLVEKVQLLRIIDQAFDEEVNKLGWTRALDTIAKWHALGGWKE